METEPHILVVDDDSSIRDLLGRFLRQHNYRVSLAKDGDNMRAQVRQNKFDLIILDIMMPGDDGLLLCRELRTQSEIPIIMLTAVSEDVERILGLEMGADDYLSKPFNPRELLARTKAILRRSRGATHALLPTKQDQHVLYEFADWQLDQTARSLKASDGLEITLSGGEFDLLLAFVQHPQHVLSRDRLLDLTKHREAGPFDRSIDIQISRLRRKIELDPKNPQLIKTVRGGGYVLAENVKHNQKTENKNG